MSDDTSTVDDTRNRKDTDRATEMDDGNEDPWTEGPQVSLKNSRKGKSGKSDEATGFPGDDAETLRERQRLAQLGMLDHWIGGVLAEQRRSRRWKLFFRFLLVALVAALLFAPFYRFFWEGPGGPEFGRDHLGVVEIQGVIARDSPASAERIIEGMTRAWEAENSVAVILHIDSPGGSPVQSQRVYAEVMRLREAGDKPIMAVIEDIGASGGYYIASAADEIVASPASLVGSIGVVYSGFGFEEAISELGVERRLLTAGENKGFLDPFQALEEEDKQFWQAVLNDTHQQFINAVRAGRGDRLSDNEALFSGLVWSGSQSLELGLIDTLATMEEVGRQLLPEPQWVDYTPQLDPFERFTRGFTRTAAQVLGLEVSASPLRFQAR